MAGSLSHIVGDDGRFSMDTIDNLGDAHEALEECFDIILELSKGDMVYLNAVLRKVNAVELDRPMRARKDDEEW